MSPLALRKSNLSTLITDTINDIFIYNYCELGFLCVYFTRLVIY
jgi:3-isopropylmalate dehydratase small subunit